MAFDVSPSRDRGVRSSGGAAPKGVERETESLDDDQAQQIEEWLRGLALELKREAAGM